MEHNFWALFDAVAAAIPERECIVWRGTRRTYAETADRARRLAAVLTAHGLGAHTAREGLRPWESGQSMVGLYLLNGPEYLEATFGGYAARAAPYNVNYRYVADELAYLFDDAATDALVYHARFAPDVAQVLDRLTHRPRLLIQVADDSGQPLLPGALDYETALAAADPALATTGHAPDDLYVLYTGGTTGMPKGTLWRQHDLWAATIGGDDLAEADVATVVGRAVAGGPRLLPNAPFMHGAAGWLAHRAMLGGGTVVVNGVVDHLDAVDVWATVARERVDAMLFVGEAFARPLLAELERAHHDTSSLKLLVTGGAVMSPETKARLLDRIPNAMLQDSAGASETGGVLGAVSTRGAVTEAGVFQPGPTVALLDETKTRLLSPGEDAVGWFAKKGAIPLGYLGDPDKTAATFPTVEGVRWSVPGDRARYRPDGRVELLGRDSVTINTAGEKVFAEEVEAALLRHPAVRDTVVVGRPSERWGSEVVAVVALHHDVDDADLLATAGRHIARYKLPKAIVRLPEIVRSPAGKADYRWGRTVADRAEP